MGVTFDSKEQSFIFDFEHDGKNDIITLTSNGYQVEAFGRCFYYGYEFSDDVDGSIRSEFIKYVKFSGPLQEHPDLTHFMQKAVNELNRKINLYNYDLVVMPESSSQVNKYLLRYIYRFAQPSLHGIELVKSLPESISFDMESYNKQYLEDLLENGRPRYTEVQKEEVRDSIRNMMELIHRKDYFTIAKDVRKSRMRPYVTNFLRFKNQADERLCSAIREQNILIVDDIATSGSTLNEVLRSLRIMNEDNNITIFSLIGRKDLMADAI